MTAPISDEAARALLNARYGEPVTSTGDFLPASYERAKAEIAAVAPLLVSAEAERRSWTLRDPSLWQLINDADPAVRQLLIEAWADRDDALAVVEGLRAELAAMTHSRDSHRRWLLQANTELSDATAALRAAGGQEKPTDEHRTAMVAATLDTMLRSTHLSSYQAIAERIVDAVLAAAPVGGQAEPSDATNWHNWDCNRTNCSGCYDGPKPRTEETR